jgi:hypothetical protein
VVLHSFKHLSSSKLSPQFAEKFLEKFRVRLERTGYEVMTTPFGYVNEFRMYFAGYSLAKVFKEFEATVYHRGVDVEYINRQMIFLFAGLPRRDTKLLRASRQSHKLHSLLPCRS